MGRASFEFGTPGDAKHPEPPSRRSRCNKIGKKEAIFSQNKSE
jgi:hypothetical protein